jgi:hypothetical protein
MRETYFDCANIGILGRVFVLVKTIFRELASSQVDTELDEEEHNGLERGDRTITSPLRDNMFVEDGERGRCLANADEFLGALQRVSVIF